MRRPSERTGSPGVGRGAGAVGVAAATRVGAGGVAAAAGSVMVAGPAAACAAGAAGGAPTTVPSGRIVSVRTRLGSPSPSAPPPWAVPFPATVAVVSGDGGTIRVAWRRSTGCSSRLTTLVLSSWAARS
jgi:hypothetical protein